MKLRLLHAYGVASLGFVLACGLIDGDQPGAPVAPVATPAPSAESDIVFADTPRIAKARRAPPVGEVDDVIRGRYVMKLKHADASGVGSDGRLATGNPRIDAALGKAGMRKARAVHRRGKGANRGLYAVDADNDVGFKSLASDPDVDWIEPVHRYEMTGYSDPYYRFQWDMSELNLESVHARAQGVGVVVAVVDSGVSKGADSPILMLSGWDFMDDDADASDTAAASQSPSGSHGTHVAGTIAQASNNGVGVTGIAPMASILPVRVGDYNGISSENIAEGIEWAVDNGANVINVSIGGASASRVVQDACQYAYDHGVVVVAASGNDGYDGKISYPAAFPTVIAVGAHDAAFKETAYSNNGPELALLAPGGDTSADLNHDGKPDGILQGTISSKGWGYGMMQGTSMASPHVAGAAAILISAGVRGPDAIRAALMNGATMQGATRVLNILGSLDYAASGVVPAPVAPVPVAPVADAPVPGGRKHGAVGGGPGAPAGRGSAGVAPSGGGPRGSGEKGGGRKRPGKN